MGLCQRLKKLLYISALALASFFDKQPALLYGLFVYSGIVYALLHSLMTLFPALFILFFAIQSGCSIFNRRIVLSSILLLFSCIYTSQTIVEPPATFTEIPGLARLTVSTIRTDIRYGRTFYRLDGEIASFVPDCGGFVASNIPCMFVWHQKNTRPRAEHMYEVRGVLRRQELGYSFKPDLDSPWEMRDSCFSLAELRYSLKAKARCFFAEYIPPGTVRSFLEGVCFGEFHDMHLKACLKRFGLQHIVVVSGFHFALLVAICLALFRLVLSLRYSQCAAACVATLFFLFIGPTASVYRAYIAALCALGAALSEKRTSGMNALGLGLILVSLSSPTSCLTPGFTLSFLATWAILLLQPLCKRFIFSLVPAYAGGQIAYGTILEQAVFTMSTCILSALSLVCAVTCLMLPTTLYVFNSFPLLGLVYNIFFPFGISVALFFVILGMLFFWLPPVCSVFLALGSGICDWMLTPVMHAPTGLDIVLFCEWIPLWALLLYLCLFSLFVIVYEQEHKSRLC